MKTLKKLTSAEQKHVEEIYTKLPNGLKKVGIAANKATLFLMNEIGYSQTHAEDCVLEVLKEAEPYLKKGMFASTIKSLEMIFS